MIMTFKYEHIDQVKNGQVKRKMMIQTMHAKKVQLRPRDALSAWAFTMNDKVRQ